jgi:hypothetical protein
MHLNHTFGYLTWAPDDLLSLTTHLRKEVRKLWDTPWIPNAILHAPRKEVGGMQLPHLYDVYSVRHLTQFAQTMWGGDERISSALWSNIQSVQAFHDIQPVNMKFLNNNTTPPPRSSHGETGKNTSSETSTPQTTLSVSEG